MLDDARQFGFAAEVFVQVIEFVFINGRDPVYTATFRNLKKINRFYRAKLAVGPPPVKRGDLSQCLHTRPRVTIIKDAGRQISAAGGRIILFTGRDERFNDVGQLHRNFRFFTRRKPMDFPRVLSQFAIRENAEAH